VLLISAQKISKGFSAKPLFEGLTFTIAKGDRVGLIGPNGAGKSTLLGLLANEASPDGGVISRMNGLKTGHLKQVPNFSPQATVLETLLEVTDDPHDWEQIAKAHELISRLELDLFSESTTIEELSGGWKKRVALARELMKSPDLLLLDEPTNHLDVESILWLEEYLSEAPFATVTVTHDRLFLQKIANRIVEIDRRHINGLIDLRGTYADFLETRDALLSAQRSQEQKLRNTLQRETEWLRRGAQARQTKQQARIKAAQNLSETVSDLSSRNQERLVRLDFQSQERNPKKMIEAKGISKAFGEQFVVPQLDLLIGAKSRIGLMGRNGCGKSTLIKLLTKTLAPDTGQVFHADHLKISYFEQNRDSLDPNVTVFRTVCPSGDHVDFAGTPVHARGYLARFLFNADQMETPVGRLSGGEQSRLLLARLMLTKANVLVLDEPTNDLDMATLDVLSDVLEKFNGPIILVTHDRYFLDQLTNLILAFGQDESGQPILVPMVGLDQWNAWYETQKEKPPAHQQSQPEEQRPRANPTKIKRRIEKLESEIAELEHRIHTQEMAMSGLTGLPAQDYSVRHKELIQNLTRDRAALEALVLEWETLSQEP
jgi:ABC transport system ATP-binding/permease protein